MIAFNTLEYSTLGLSLIHLTNLLSSDSMILSDFSIDQQ